ncbi:hypothetical protein HS088_TW06G01229 [Tripterygium wilfordii]|uniref:EF-hand domain-containing protein n=1 Tax=Tripterygium wilfordii TaxID=458696 RepID=A0A7J7DL08_TRIWF|nr:hypothetical protein HS088_TW06G01229 [Tripterygium wilfordii]
MPFVGMENESVLTEQLRKIFTEHANKDGQMGKEELKKAFRKLGAMFPNWRAQRALQHADADGDGIISISEMDDLVKYAFGLGHKIENLTPASKSYSRRESEEPNRSSFSDKDGQISKEKGHNML